MSGRTSFSAKPKECHHILITIRFRATPARQRGRTAVDAQPLLFSIFGTEEPRRQPEIIYGAGRRAGGLPSRHCNRRSAGRAPYACLCPQVRRSMGGLFRASFSTCQCERESFRRLGRLWKKSEGKNILWWMMCAVVHAVAARTSSETGFGKGFRFWAGRRYADRAAGTRDYRADTRDRGGEKRIRKKAYDCS